MVTTFENILVITSTYPRDDQDYAVPWMREIHRQLAGRGHNVTVLAPSYQGLKSHDIDGISVKRFRYAPAKIERLTHEEGATNKVRGAWLMQLLGIPYIIFGCIAAAWIVRKQKFDVIHVHWPFPHGIMGQVARFFSGAPLVIMSHGAEYSLARRKKWIMPILRQSLRAADLRIGNSHSTSRMAEACSGRKCHVLPYGTTVQEAKPAQSSSSETSGLSRVLFTGRLIERKGLEYLLRAVPQIIQRVPATFIITGDGDQRKRLEQLTDELNLTESVKFLGFIPRKQLAEEYAKCDVWVNPGIVDSWGDAEGLGVGSIEAYSHFKPVVSTRVGGIPDTIRHGETGYLVPEKDSEALADAIVELLSHPSKCKRFGLAGFKFAKETFSWERIVLDLEMMYRFAGSRQHRYQLATAGRWN